MARTNVFRLKDTAVSRLRTELTGNTDKLIFRPTKNNDEHIWKDPINNTVCGILFVNTMVPSALKLLLILISSQLFICCLMLGLVSLYRDSGILVSGAPTTPACKESASDESECILTEKDHKAGGDPTIFDALGPLWENAQSFLQRQVLDQTDVAVDATLPRDPFPHLAAKNNDQPAKKQQEDDPFRQLGQSFQAWVDSISDNMNKPDRSSQPGLKESSLTTLLLQTTSERISKRQKSSNSRNLVQLLELFVQTLQDVLDQLEKNFQSLFGSLPSSHRWNPLLAIWYSMEHTEQVLTPSQKKRLHWFDKPFQSVDAMEELHGALYLSQLAYANTIRDIKKGLSQFQQTNSWELLYANVQGFPGEPAHFLAVRKEAKRKRKKGQPKSAIQKLLQPAEHQHYEHGQSTSVLEVLLVVRGTKELGDMLSDGLLEASEFLGGLAHAGIARAGHYLVNQHTDTLHELWKVSGHDRLQLSLVGHSLGAGAAAVASMLWNHNTSLRTWMDKTTSVGFGCPALISSNVASRFQDSITTVVSDSDLVPRMSGASLVNMVLDAMSFDWTDKALVDLELILQHLGIPPKQVLQWANETMETFDRPYFGKVTKERVEPVLFPPGNCIHLFRDGVGTTGTYSNCSTFRAIEVTRTMVDDHLIPPGYHRAMLEWMRQQTNNPNFAFENDLLGIPT